VDHAIIRVQGKITLEADSEGGINATIISGPETFHFSISRNVALAAAKDALRIFAEQDAAPSNVRRMGKRGHG
jgi:hypothetical protein